MYVIPRNSLRRLAVMLAVGTATYLLSSLDSEDVLASIASPQTTEAVRSPETRQAFQELRVRALNTGSVRVIVGVRADNYVLEGQLAGEPERQSQRNRIAAAQDALLAPVITRVTDLKRYQFIPFVAMEVDLAVLDYLEASPDVVTIEEDRLGRPFLGQSIPLINADDAWAAGYTGSGQTVAVLDTGVDKTHTDFGGRVVSEACYSSGTSLCPGGVTESTAGGSGVNCGINGCDHGTRVAGVVAGNGSNPGVAKAANIIAINVFHQENSGATCGADPTPCVRFFFSDLIKALERVYALRNTYKIAAVNGSLGDGNQYGSACDGSFASTKAIIDQLRGAKIAGVFASGNNGYTNGISSPACISSAVSVGSTGDGSGGTIADQVSSFSNSGTILDLLAPGNQIIAPIPGNTYGGSSGTSFAAPHVAGAWAILKGKENQASVDQVLQVLKSTGVNVLDSRNSITKPRIDVGAAANAFVLYSAFLPLVSRPPTSPVADCNVFGDDFNDGNVSDWSVTNGTGTVSGNKFAFSGVTGTARATHTFTATSSPMKMTMEVESFPGNTFGIFLYSSTQTSTFTPVGGSAIRGYGVAVNSTGSVQFYTFDVNSNTPFFINPATNYGALTDIGIQGDASGFHMIVNGTIRQTHPPGLFGATLPLTMDRVELFSNGATTAENVCGKTVP